ncbi:MAG: DUF2442 domain-containing protein [Rubrobacter sp.]|nr:DUF2442 domain-containing protein [Rubrobacter sp.]
MSSSTTRIPAVGAEAVTVTEDTLTVELSDGRSISVPLAWYPRLVRLLSLAPARKLSRQDKPLVEITEQGREALT